MTNSAEVLMNEKGVESQGFVWRRFEYWLINEVLLLVVFGCALLYPIIGGIRWVGLATAFCGLVSLCIWYAWFVRVWERTSRLSQQTGISLQGPYFLRANSGSDRRVVRVRVRVNPARYWVLLEEQVQGLRTPGPLLVLLFCLVWYFVWVSAVIVALKQIDSGLQAEFKLAILVFEACVSGGIIVLINPKLHHEYP